jgi:hypothetical protein
MYHVRAASCIYFCARSSALVLNVSPANFHLNLFLIFLKKIFSAPSLNIKSVTGVRKTAACEGVPGLQK